jgi:hypothetical protein
VDKLLHKQQEMRHMKEFNLNKDSDLEKVIDVMFTFSAPVFEVLMVNKHLDRSQ